ncbi:MAG: sialate O-acetylesterase [Candidatus Hydrogenedens sp.]|nr:sialate O-acetylesterase [Candidatus Hydrogenedens sp.]
MKRKLSVSVAACCASVAMLWSSAASALEMPSIFGDHMVLQQGKDLPVWGWGEPGEAVRVRLGGRSEKTTADEQGNWKVTFTPFETGRPLKMKVSGESDTLSFEDVLIGEVWVASGQSNMQWTVGNSNNSRLEIEQADHPELRLFYVPRTVADEPQRDCDAEWVVCTPETVPEFSAVAYFFGRDLNRELGVPVGMIHSSWGGTPAEAWTTIDSIHADPMLQPISERWDAQAEADRAARAAYEEAHAAWQAAADKSAAEPEAPKPGNRDSWQPGGLYNAMIAPLVPYAIQGAIWYQGESNADRAFQYRTLFPRMIMDWHEAWGEGAFPFLFVQLANFQARQAEPVDSAWAELREAQAMTLDAVENSGQAVIIDLGSAIDIHPRNKQDVGWRLALNALANTYGQDVAYRGPAYESMSVEGNKATLTFSHAEHGLQSWNQGKLVGFSIAGADQKFVWADAKIVGDNQVQVWSDAVAEPVAVRYGWADNPECNLYDGTGLPASPSRTDDWPGVTVEAR